LLALIIAKSHRLVKPYVDPILRVLIPKAKDASAGIASTALGGIGELAIVGGPEMIPYLKELMQIVIDNLQDQSSALRRDAALKTLGQLVRYLLGFDVIAILAG
jgi:FKBP12-rapamycin complex-associated protein